MAGYGFYTGPLGTGQTSTVNTDVGVNTNTGSQEGGTAQGSVTPTVPMIGNTPAPGTNPSQTGAQGFGVPGATPSWLSQYQQAHQVRNTGEQHVNAANQMGMYGQYQDRYGAGSTPFAYLNAGSDPANPLGGGLNPGGSYDFLQDFNSRNNRGSYTIGNQIMGQGSFAANGDINSGKSYDPLTGSVINAGNNYALKNYGVGSLDPANQPAWSDVPQAFNGTSNQQSLNQAGNALSAFKGQFTGAGYGNYYDGDANQKRAYLGLMQQYQQVSRYVPGLTFAQYVTAYNKRYGSDSSNYYGTPGTYTPEGIRSSEGASPSYTAPDVSAPVPISYEGPNANNLERPDYSGL